MTFPLKSLVVIQVGNFADCIGVVQDHMYGDWHGVSIPGVTEPGEFLAYSADELIAYDGDMEDESDEDYEASPSDTVPAFGMTGEQVAVYFERFMDAAVTELVQEGVGDKAKQGFQSFEGLTFEQVLDRTLIELENSAAAAVKSHIVIQRMLTAYKEIND